jgi:ADP-L-glycero-D-manno-heptose 6-epimerase
MSVLVTGAIGFIGSHLVKSLNEPIICDRTPGSGVCLPDEIDIHFQDLDAVYHLGAISSTTETDTRKIAENNILLSCMLLEECVSRNIPFVYASSASVYGLGENGFSEDAAMSPLNYYAISKSTFDQIALQKIKDNPSAQIFGLRYFNVYGSNEDHKGDQASPIHKFMNQAYASKEIQVFIGSDSFRRDFIHVDDVVRITLAAKNFTRSGIYNVGTGVPRSFMDVASIVAEFTNSRVIEVSFPENLVGKYQKYTCSDNTKIQSVLKNNSRITLEHGIRNVLNDR